MLAILFSALAGFILGIVGLATTLIVTLILMGRTTQRVVNKMASTAAKVSLEKGFIVEPDSAIDSEREEIIKKNKKKGLDTKIEDLM